MAVWIIIIILAARAAFAGITFVDLLAKALRLVLLTIIPLGLVSIGFGQALTLTPLSGTAFGGDVGVFYNPLFTLSATGGTPPYTYSTVGAPSWLAVSSSTGLATGAPTTTGTYIVTTKVVDHVGTSETQSITFDVAPDVSIISSALPNAQVGVPYNVQIQAGGGTPSFPVFSQLYYWSVAIAGSLPPGLSLTSSGLTTSITGTPSGAGGTFEFTLHVTDSDGSWAGTTASRAFSIVVSGSSASANLSATPASLSFNYTIGGIVPTTQTISVGSSNPGSGMTFNALVGVGTWLSVGQANGTTPGSVSVSVNPSGLAAGVYNGTATISSPSASNSPLTVPVTLTVTVTGVPVTYSYDTGGHLTTANYGNGSVITYTYDRAGNLIGRSLPGPVITSVTTAYAGPVIAQNTFIVIKGANLVPATTPASGAIWSTAPSFASGLMPTQLGGVSVTVNKKPAFVYFYCSAATDQACAQDQLNILTPLDNTIGSVPVVVTSGAISTPAFTVNMQAGAPSFLLFSAAGYVAATHADNSLIGPTSLYPGLSTPATPGETIILWTVGFGLPVTPPANGSASQTGSLPVLPVCQVGGHAALLTFAGLNGGPGLYQLNLIIPATAANGDNAIGCTYNGAKTPTGDIITILSQ